MFTSFTFSVTKDKVNSVLKSLSEMNGVTLTGTGPWTISGDGVVANVSYLEPTLDVKIVKKPFFISNDTIENEINKVIGFTK